MLSVIYINLFYNTFSNFHRLILIAFLLFLFLFFLSIDYFPYIIFIWILNFIILIFVIIIIFLNLWRNKIRFVLNYNKILNIIFIYIIISFIIHQYFILLKLFYSNCLGITGRSISFQSMNRIQINGLI
jgi:hypothetical protein